MGLLIFLAANSAMSDLRNSKIQGLWACACEVEIAQFEGTQNKEQTRNQTKTGDSEIAKTGSCRDSKAVMSTSRVSESISGNSRPAVVGIAFSLLGIALGIGAVAGARPKKVANTKRVIITTYIKSSKFT